MATVEAPETLGIRPFNEFDGVFDVWPRGDRPGRDPRRGAPVPRALRDRREPRARGEDGGPRVGRLPGVVRLPRRRQDAQPVHQHRQPARDRAVRGLRGEPQDARVGADDRRGRRRGAVLRPAAEALRRVPLLQGLRDLLQHGRGGDREVRHHAGRRRLRELRPPARAGPAPDHGHDAAGAGRVRAAQAVLPEREVPVPAQGGRHLQVAAPDAVGVVRAGRDGRRDRGQPRAARRGRRARQGRRDRRGRRATRTATTASR